MSLGWPGARTDANATATRRSDAEMWYYEVRTLDGHWEAWRSPDRPVVTVLEGGLRLAHPHTISPLIRHIRRIPESMRGVALTDLWRFMEGVADA